MSLRAPDEHRRLIRDVAMRLRSDPAFLPALEAMLADQPQHDVSRRVAHDDVLRRITELEAHTALTAEGAAIDALAQHNAMRDVLRRVAELEAALRVLRRDAFPVEPDHDPRQTDIEDFTGCPAPTPRNAPEAKAERKEWAATILALPGAQGRTRKALAEEVAGKTGLATNTVLNVLGGSIPASAETQAKIRAAVDALEAE